MADGTRPAQMPLTGVRVLDLGRHLAGPTCAMLLGDLGADVIKVEKPGVGEDGRAAGPPFFSGISAFFLSANRNKRSLTLDIKRPEGQAVFQRLAETADVVVENFRPGVMDALGIGYAATSARNPRIIYCAISGFGADGPFADRPGLDQIIQGVSGLMSVTGFEGGEPVRVGIPIADLLTGLYGAYGIMAALQARERTGRGQVVNTSLLEAMVGTMGFQAVRYLNGGGVPPPLGIITRSTPRTACSGPRTATSRSGRPGGNGGRCSVSCSMPTSGWTIRGFRATATATSTDWPWQS